ncbi:hypothetical protein IFM89_004441 [Coptis chinensis]|uniref:ATP-dependent zinc metalloprotease n=1 Tax=Coptis chinensis TaxID=261450 RepID=A0A835GUJ7_9MAGN|nr:hypothetical protein IFM89_004441 [Coptis chinensis]
MASLYTLPQFHSPTHFSKPKTKLKKPIKIKSLKGWKEYDEAVKKKDLARALKFLKTTQTQQQAQQTQPSSSGLYMGNEDGLSFLGTGRDWEVLDACLNADDMKLVGNAYKFLQDRGFLPSFGITRNIVLEGSRDITPTALKSSTGLEASKLSPKKWGLSGSSSAVLVAFLGGTSYLISQGIDIRPNIAAVLGLAFLDSILLGGSCLAQISSYWPPYRRRILVHEAGHLLTGKYFTSNQAGTQFWDEKLENELADGRLSSASFDRYCMVLFAGIAAEALVYGEAEGGENDENLFRSICLLLQPPLPIAQMSNQARWAVLQSYNLLKWHRHVHLAAFKALESGDSLSAVIRKIEEAILENR